VGHRFRGTAPERKRTEGRHRRAPRRVKVKPEQVKYVGISHVPNADHTGQLAPFAGANAAHRQGRLAMASRNPADAGANEAGLQGLDGREIPKGRGPDPRQGRYGATHGEGDPHARHTPRAQQLLVRLQSGTNFLPMARDAAHFRENYESNGVPPQLRRGRPRRSRRSSGMKKIERTSTRPYHPSTTCATSASCRLFRLQRSSRRFQETEGRLRVDSCRPL